MIDLDRVLDRPVAQVRGAEIDDVDEQQAVVGQQLPDARERAGDVEQMIDGLADDDHVEAALAEVVLFDKAGDGLQAEGARACSTSSGAGSISGPRQPELTREVMRDDARRPADVEHRARARPPVMNGRTNAARSSAYSRCSSWIVRASMSRPWNALTSGR